MREKTKREQTQQKKRHGVKYDHEATRHFDEKIGIWKKGWH